MFCLLWRDIKKNCVLAVLLNENEVHGVVINYDNEKSSIHVAIAYGIEITLVCYHRGKTERISPCS